MDSVVLNPFTLYFTTNYMLSTWYLQKTKKPCPILISTSKLDFSLKAKNSYLNLSLNMNYIN